MVVPRDDNGEEGAPVKVEESIGALFAAEVGSDEGGLLFTV